MQTLDSYRREARVFLDTMNTHLIWNGVRLDRANPTAPGFYLWAANEHSHISAVTIADVKAWANMPGFYCRLVPDPANVVAEHTPADIHAKSTKHT